MKKKLKISKKFNKSQNWEILEDDIPMMPDGGRTPVRFSYGENINDFVNFDSSGVERNIPINLQQEIRGVIQNEHPSFQYLPTSYIASEYGYDFFYNKPRAKLKPIQIDKKEGLLEPTSSTLKDINPIPFEQGTFFTAERKSQEADRGKKDYFDKKTGKLLGTYGDGGKISLDEFRPKFSNSNQNIQKEIINKQKFENSKVVQQQKTLETIKNLQEKYREKYEPSQSVKNSKSFLSAGQLAQPLNLPLKAIATGADLETSLRYALDGQYNKSLEDLVQAGVNWIPFLQQEKMLNLSKGLPSLAYRFNKAIPKINQATDYIQKGSDIKTIIEVKKNGGKIPKAGDGKNMGYSWSTQQVPTQQVVGSVENTQTSKPSIQPFQKGYVNPKTMTSKTGEEGLGDDLGGMMVTTALAPGSLPFRASGLGRVGLEALELANPISGFRGIKPKFALQNADPILTNQTKGFNVEYDGLLDFQKKAGFEPYKFDNKNWYDVPDESEINWKAWNEEIPNNKALMQEYKTIEQSSKANGTWMKNPDGSAFRGTPEQFVQQNSENFKKAFPDYYGEILNHNSPNKFDYFSDAHFGKTSDRGWYGKGVYAHPEQTYTSTYGENNYKLYANSKNKGIINKENYAASKAYQRDYNKELKDLEKTKELKIKEILENPKEYEDVDFWKKTIENQSNNSKLKLIKEQDEGLKHNINKYTTLTNPYNGEVVIPFNNRIKSAVGNNGMFDMTNPNIYKGLAPIGIAGAATQIEQKKSGGKIKLKPKSSDWEIVG